MARVKKGLYICRGHANCRGQGTQCPHSKPHLWSDVPEASFLGCYNNDMPMGVRVTDDDKCMCERTSKLKRMVEGL